jgi:hypothetical protein
MGLDGGKAFFDLDQHQDPKTICQVPVTIIPASIDGQVRLVCLQMDNFCLFLRQTINFRLHDEQIANGLKKIV